MCAVLTDSHLQKHKAVLVYSQLGISRSTAIVVAYLMAENKWSLQVSYRHQLRRLCLCYCVCVLVCLPVCEQVFNSKLSTNFEYIFWRIYFLEDNQLSLMNAHLITLWW